jgi:hypothetical protein
MHPLAGCAFPETRTMASRSSRGRNEGLDATTVGALRRPPPIVHVALIRGTSDDDPQHDTTARSTARPRATLVRTSTRVDTQDLEIDTLLGSANGP